MTAMQYLYSFTIRPGPEGVRNAALTLLLDRVLPDGEMTATFTQTAFDAWRAGLAGVGLELAGIRRVPWVQPEVVP
jgi:hypothetical protein